MLRSASVDDKVVKYVHESQDENKSTDDKVIVHLEKKRFEINHDSFNPLLSHQKVSVKICCDIIYYGFQPSCISIF